MTGMPEGLSKDSGSKGVFPGIHCASVCRLHFKLYLVIAIVSVIPIAAELWGSHGGGKEWCLVKHTQRWAKSSLLVATHRRQPKENDKRMPELHQGTLLYHSLVRFALAPLK